MGDTDHHELTRRDAIGALTAAGAASVAGCSSLFGGDETNHEQATMRALASVLYPSQIDATDEFLQTYLYGRIADEAAYEADLQTAVETLDGLAQDQHGAQFRNLDTSQQRSVITETEIRSGESRADGSAVERLNYYLVDELLFACYASPTGGGLVGNENPRGWPGGFGYVPEAPQ